MSPILVTPKHSRYTQHIFLIVLRLNMGLEAPLTKLKTGSISSVNARSGETSVAVTVLACGFFLPMPDLGQRCAASISDGENSLYIPANRNGMGLWELKLLMQIP